MESTRGDDKSEIVTLFVNKESNTVRELLVVSLLFFCVSFLSKTCICSAKRKKKKKNKKKLITISKMATSCSDNK